MTKQTEAPDVLVPDPQVRREMGGISEMTMFRWDADPNMAAQGWPPPVKIRGHKFRSRRQLEQFKHNMLTEAVKDRQIKTALVKQRKQRVAK